MTGDFGVQFAPTAQNQLQNQQNGQASTPIQDAIKVLSLRIPQFVGARGVAPNALMQAAGGAGMATGGMGLEQWLAQLFGQMGGGGMAPPPNVIPGGEARYPTPAGTGDDTLIGGIKNPPTFQPGGGAPQPPMMNGGKKPAFQMY